MTDETLYQLLEDLEKIEEDAMYGDGFEDELPYDDFYSYYQDDEEQGVDKYEDEDEIYNDFDDELDWSEDEDYLEPFDPPYPTEYREQQ